jgi:hypothetical protein
MRWGKQPGYVVFAGQKIPLERLRVRTREGQEVELESRFSRTMKSGPWSSRFISRHDDPAGRRGFERQARETGCTGKKLRKPTF